MEPQTNYLFAWNKVKTDVYQNDPRALAKQGEGRNHTMEDDCFVGILEQM